MPETTTKDRTETDQRDSLTASADPTATQVVLASGRIVTVTHGPDFGTLVRLG